QATPAKRYPGTRTGVFVTATFTPLLPSASSAWRVRRWCGVRCEARASRTVAFLELLAAAAGARVVAPNLGRLAARRAALCLRLARRLAAAAHGQLRRLRLAALLETFQIVGTHGLHGEHFLHRVLVHAVDHLLEHLEPLLLVLLQGVALAVAAQADAFLEMVHVEE